MVHSMSETTWISIEDAAARLKKTVRQLYGHCREGLLVYKKEYGHVHISRDSLEAFMVLHESPSALIEAEISSNFSRYALGGDSSVISKH